MRRFTLALVWCVAVAPAPAAFVQLRPIADTTLFETTPTNNLGGVRTLAAGTTARSKRSRALLRFDFAGAIPSNAVILDATLTLEVVRAPAGGGGENSTFGLHRVLRSWSEGTKSTEANGAPAGAGEPTWLARAHPSTLWSAPGAASPTDYVETASASQHIGGYGPQVFAGLAGDVQLWRSNPGTNFGWLVVGQDEVTPTTARRFGAKEETDNAPEVEVEYMLPFPPAPRFTGVRSIGGGLQFQFEAAAGFSYEVQHRPAVGAGLWLTLTNLPAGTFLRNVVVADMPPTNGRFYRAVAR